MDFLYELGLFAVKALVIVSAIIGVVLFLLQAGMSRGGREQAPLEVDKLNRRFRSFRRQMQGHLMEKKKYKSLVKAEKKTAKKDDESKSSRLFVLDFQGDIRATQVEGLREEITAILSIAEEGDEVVVRLESGGGLVTSYGLAASQLDRLRAAKVKLIVCVDKIAASGGYMMACVADQILAAPFAVVGSIGVVAQVPNVNRLLKRLDVDYREVTAGEFKRTVSVFGEITPPGMEKFKSQIEETHQLFKDFVQSKRPRLDISRVATGEHWYGTQALELGLVDEITTSDDYLFKRYETSDVYSIRQQSRKRLSERISESFSITLTRIIDRLLTQLSRDARG